MIRGRLWKESRYLCPSTSQSLADWPAEGRERGTGLLLYVPALAASQAPQVSCQRTVTTWPTSLGCLSAQLVLHSAQLVLHWRAPCLLRTAQPMPRGIFKRRKDYIAYESSRLDGPSDTTTRLTRSAGQLT